MKSVCETEAGWVGVEHRLVAAGGHGGELGDRRRMTAEGPGVLCC